MSLASEIRQVWWSKPLGHILWFFITALCFTLRKRVTGDASVLRTQQHIVAIWHNRIFTPCYFYRYVLRGQVEMSMLTSASRDGAMLATVAHDYGMSAVRGSGHRRGAEGFMDMVRELQTGKSMCITPDGPKGPVYCCRPGIVKLASMSGISIIPIRMHYSACLRVRSWDRFFIPLPFSVVTMELCEPLTVRPDLTSEELAAECHRLESILRDDDYSYLHPKTSQQTKKP